MIVTKAEIKYCAAPYGYIATIPKGTLVLPATNIPLDIPRYWVQPWKGMSIPAQSWFRNYGFLVDWTEVEDFTPTAPRLPRNTDNPTWCYAKA